MKPSTHSFNGKKKSLLMNLIVVHLVKKSIHFCGTKSFIIVFVNRAPDISSPYILTRCLCQIGFNIILPLTPRSSRRSLLFRFSDIRVYAFLILPVAIRYSLLSPPPPLPPPLFRFPKLIVKLSLDLIN